MDEEKVTVKLEADVHVARLIIETAEWQARCVPKDQIPGRITTDLVREAADFVFLALCLITERADENATR